MKPETKMPEALELVPKERPACPFYGFNYVHGALFDTKGNQCSVIEDSYSPCQMEVRGDEPNWFECYLNTKENNKRLGEISNAKVFPHELNLNHPWDGISFKDWVRYIMKKTLK